MRRLSRLERPVGLLRFHSKAPSSSLFLCSLCRKHVPFSTSSHQAARQGSITGAEKLRRKIWGTDQPPGLEDPYNPSSSLNMPKTARMEEETQSLDASGVDSRGTSLVDMSSYEPAPTWEGLDEVGEEPEEEFYFEGFPPAEVITDPYQATAALHRAVVEVFTLRKAGRPLSELSEAPIGLDETAQVQIFVQSQQSASPVLDYSTGISEDLILKSLTKQQLQQGSVAIEDEPFAAEGLEGGEVIKPPGAIFVAAGEHSVKAISEIQDTSYERQVSSWDPAWLRIHFGDLEIKFAIFKRVMQLTGIRIPDSALESARTVHSLLEHITTPAKPKKLAEALMQKGNLVSLPNVKIFERRVTPIDKEISVGRWKVIERELKSRGLPVTGY